MNQPTPASLSARQTYLLYLFLLHQTNPTPLEIEAESMPDALAQFHKLYFSHGGYQIQLGERLVFVPASSVLRIEVELAE